MVLGVFLDLSKAFDSVHHTILLRKLHEYGIRGVCHNWIKSYLTQRKQYVCFDGINSEYGFIKSGVPQGSILGPLLFLLYVNDISNISQLLFPILFADDTNIFLSGNNIDGIIDIMNGEIKKIIDWLDSNMLSLNIDKTHYIIFSSKLKKLRCSKQLYIREKPIKLVTSIKFLGVILDSRLTWFEHIQYIKSKISRALGILFKAKKVFDENTIKTLYNSLIYPYLSYCVEVWGSATESCVSSLVKLQKRAVRIIVSASYKAHTGPIFQKLNLLNINKIYLYNVALFMFKFENGFLPNIFDNLFCQNITKSNYFTRQRNRLIIPKTRTVLCQKTIRYVGVKVWSYLCKTMKFDSTIISVKRILKQYFLNTIIPDVAYLPF